MRHRHLSPLVVAALVLAALPATAEVYTIRLSNGTTFESRYQPKQASWDPTMVTFLAESGNEIALPQALITEVVAQSETKGYGRVIDTATIDLGFMPNDLDQSQALMQQQAQMNAGQQIFGNSATQQFVDPRSVGGGIPIGFGNFNGFNGSGGGAGTGGVPGGGVFNTPSGGTPAPFTTPTNTTTPAPFTIPSPGTAAPTTTPPSTQ